MPRSTVQDEPDYRLPKDVPLPAILNSVKEKEIRWNDRDTGKEQTRVKWVWEFKIHDGEFAGLSAYEETEDRVTNRSNNRPRQWLETLIGTELDLGQGVDTDDYVGMECMIVCANVEEVNKKTGEVYYKCPVVDVLPAGIANEDPPF